MKKILIVEDEPFALEDLRDSLLQISPSLQITSLQSATEALESIKSEKFDAIFLDLELPGMSGIDMLREAPSPSPPVVIVTAHAFSALEGFGLGVVDCLLKPVDEDRLRKAMAKIDLEEGGTPPASRDRRRKFGRESRRLVRVANAFRLIRLGTIFRFERSEHGSRVFFQEGNGATRSSLEDLESLLDPEVFFRINETDILNFDHIEAIQTNREGLMVARFPDGMELIFSPDRSKVFEREWQL